jgi:hypothetical protein
VTKQEQAEVKERSSGRNNWQSPVLILTGLLAFYLFMFLRYRPYEIDNAWSLSFTYSGLVQHLNGDQFMNHNFPNGQGGIQFFGKLAAYPQYVLGQTLGWTQWPMEILSAAAVVAALGLWWLQLRKLGYSNRFVSIFLVVAGISEPLLSTAEKFRPEYMAVLLISAGLSLIAYRKVFVGLMVVAVASEIEPLACLGLVPAVVLAYSLTKDRAKVVTRTIAAVAFAALAYLALHPDLLHLQSYLSQAKRVETHVAGGFVRAYFVDRRRHLPEFVFFAVAAVLYWRRRHAIKLHYPAISAAALVAAGLLAPHPNVAYMVFAYPFLVVMAMAAFQAERRPGLAMAVAAAYFLPQYGWLAYVNRGLGYRGRDIAQVADAIGAASDQLGIPDKDLEVYGDYSLWFAHPHSYHAAASSTLPYGQEAQLFLCYDRPLLSHGMNPGDVLYCPDLRRDFPLRVISTTLVRGNTLYLYAKRQE